MLIKINSWENKLPHMGNGLILQLLLLSNYAKMGDFNFLSQNSISLSLDINCFSNQLYKWIGVYRLVPPNIWCHPIYSLTFCDLPSDNSHLPSAVIKHPHLTNTDAEVLLIIGIYPTILSCGIIFLCPD